MEHTPGPWTVRTAEVLQDGRPPLKQLSVIHYEEYERGGPDTVCNIVMDYRGDIPDRNARLIAAAPALLDAALRTVQIMATCDDAPTLKSLAVSELQTAIDRALASAPDPSDAVEPEDEPASVTVCSSHGRLTINPSGRVTDYNLEPSWNGPIPILFDVAEFRTTYGKLDDEVDVLDIGFWSPDGKYDPPDAEFRKDKQLGDGFMVLPPL